MHHGVAVKIKDDKDKFKGLSNIENASTWFDVLKSDDRSAVLISCAAFDAKLERILDNSFKSGVSNKVVNQFAKRIDLCFELGLISKQVQSELHALREIRNAFAHNIFGCSFKNPEVLDQLKKVKSAELVGASFSEPRIYFHTAVLILDNALETVIQQNGAGDA